MILLQHTQILTPSDTATDIPFVFTVPDQARVVMIRLTFDPPHESRHTVCHLPVMQAINEYYVGDRSAFSEDEWVNYLPIKNLITLSLDHGARYLGNAHRWDSDQAHIFTETQTPRGFLKPELLQGRWSGMLHIHEVISPQCRVVLEVKSEDHNELDTI